MIADNQTAPHRMDIFREWLSTLIQGGEQDDRLHEVVDKLHMIFEDISPDTAPQPQVSNGLKAMNHIKVSP
jgi:hypothetical protein